VLLFSALSGLSRVFVREEEAGTAAALRLYAPPTAVFACKWMVNLAIMGLIEVLTALLFMVVLPPEAMHAGLFAGILILGGLGLAGACTFVAAVISPASSGRSALFFVVALPVLLPLLLTAVQATAGAFSDIRPFTLQACRDMNLLAGYCVVMTTASLMLFKLIWHD
jgi:heme exporter protein B